MDEISSAATLALPTLIVASTLVLSLEILDQPCLSRPLAVGVLVFLWVSLLDVDLQLGSLLLAALCQCVQAALVRLNCSGSSVNRPSSSLSSQWRYWIHVFAWAATFVCADGLAHSTSRHLVNWHPVAAATGTTLYYAIYRECAEVLLLLYYSTTPIAYRWRERAPLWICFGLLGELFHSRALSPVVAWICTWCRPASAALVVLSIQITASFVNWTAVASVVRQRWRGLVAMVRKKKPSSGRRRSFLYRTGSDVEVVEMAVHHQAYDLRHNPNDYTEASPA